jgi:hypothetical protein
MEKPLLNALGMFRQAWRALAAKFAAYAQND